MVVSQFGNSNKITKDIWEELARTNHDKLNISVSYPVQYIFDIVLSEFLMYNLK